MMMDVDIIVDEEVEAGILQPHRDVAETLKHGVGYYHEALDKEDKRGFVCGFKTKI